MPFHEIELPLFACHSSMETETALPVPLLLHADDRDSLSSFGAATSPDIKAVASESPMQWSKGFKWRIVGLLCLMSFNVQVTSHQDTTTALCQKLTVMLGISSFACLAVVPIAKEIVLDLGEDKAGRSASVLLVTVWELGEAAGSIFLAPLSETFGRSVVLNTSNIAFIIVTICAALCNSTYMLIIFRALNGLVVATTVLCPAVIGDMFAPEERGSPMSALMVAPMVGGAIGPAIGGLTEEWLGWRIVLWLSVALAAGCQLMLNAFFKETYTAEARQDSKLNLIQHLSGVSAGKGQFGTHGVWGALLRPADVLCRSVVLISLCLLHGVAFTYYYINAVTLPDVLEDIYDSSPATTGSCFICLSESRFCPISELI